MSDYIKNIAQKAFDMKWDTKINNKPSVGSYISTVKPERIRLSINIDMKHLHKAVWLSNNIIQHEKIPYMEQVLFNDDDDVNVVYFCPNKPSDLLKIDERFRVTCVLVYNRIIAHENITAGDMMELNKTYKLLIELRHDN